MNTKLYLLLALLCFIFISQTLGAKPKSQGSQTSASVVKHSATKSLLASKTSKAKELGKIVFTWESFHRQENSHKIAFN